MTSALSLLIGASIAPMAGGDAARFSALAACTALVVSAIALVSWLVRVGAVVNFISEPVMVGFKCWGCAFSLPARNSRSSSGFKGGHGDFWERIGGHFPHLGETNLTALVTWGLIAPLALLVLGKILLLKKPVALLVVIGGIIAASWFNLGS